MPGPEQLPCDVVAGPNLTSQVADELRAAVRSSAESGHDPTPTLYAVLRRRGLHRVIAVELDVRDPHRDAGHPDG